MSDPMRDCLRLFDRIRMRLGRCGELCRTRRASSTFIKADREAPLETRPGPYFGSWL